VRLLVCGGKTWGSGVLGMCRIALWWMLMLAVCFGLLARSLRARGRKGYIHCRSNAG
jgi:hypothetical protein